MNYFAATKDGYYTSNGPEGKWTDDKTEAWPLCPFHAKRLVHDLAMCGVSVDLEETKRPCMRCEREA